MSGKIKLNNYCFHYHYSLSIFIARILVRIFVLCSILKVGVDARPNPQEETYEIAQSIHLPQLSQYLQSQDVLHPQQLRNSETSVPSKTGQPLTYTVFPAILGENPKNSHGIPTLNQLSGVPSTKEAAIYDSIFRSYANYPTQADYSIASTPISGISELESDDSPQTTPVVSSIPQYEPGYSIQKTPVESIPGPDPSRSPALSNMEQFKALRIPITLIQPSDKLEFLQYARAKALDMQMVQRFLRTLTGNIEKSQADLVKQSQVIRIPNFQTNVQRDQPQPENNSNRYSEGQNFQTSALFSDSGNFQTNGYSQIPQNSETNIPFSEELSQSYSQDNFSPPPRENSEFDIRSQALNQLPVSEQLPVFRSKLPDPSKQSFSPKPISGNNVNSIPRIEIQAPPVQQPPPKIVTKFQSNILTPPHAHAKPQIELQVPAHPEPPRELQVPSEDAFLNRVVNSIKNLISEQRESKKPKPRPGGTKIIGLTAPKKQEQTEDETKGVADLKSRIVNRPLQIQNGGATSLPVSTTTVNPNFHVYVLPAEEQTVSPSLQGSQDVENPNPTQFQTPQELTNGRGPTIPPVQIVENVPDRVTPSVNTLYSLPEETQPPQELPNGRGPIGQQNPQNVPNIDNLYNLPNEGPNAQRQNIGTTGNVGQQKKADLFQIGNPIGVLHPGGNLITLTPFAFTPTASSRLQQSAESADGTNRVETISSATPSEFQNQQTSAESDKEARTLSVTLPNSATGFLYIQVGPHQPQSFVPAVPPIIPGFLPPGPGSAEGAADPVPSTPPPENKPSLPEVITPSRIPQNGDTSSTFFGGEKDHLVVPPKITENLRRPFIVSTPADGAVQVNCNINGRSIPCGTARSVPRPDDRRNGRNRVIIPGNISTNLQPTLLSDTRQVFTPENGVNELEIITNKPETGPTRTTGSDVERSQLDCLIRPAGLTRIPCATIESFPRRPTSNPSTASPKSGRVQVDCAVTPGLGLSKIPCATITSVDRNKPASNMVELNYPSIFPRNKAPANKRGLSSTQASIFDIFDTLTSASIRSSTISEETPKTETSSVVEETTIPLSTSSDTSSTKVEEINSKAKTGITISDSEKPVDATNVNLEVATGTPETEGTSTSTVPSETGSSSTVPPKTESTNVVPLETGTSPILAEVQIPTETIITSKDIRSTLSDTNSNEYSSQVDCFIKEYMFQIPCATAKE